MSTTAFLSFKEALSPEPVKLPLLLPPAGVLLASGSTHAPELRNHWILGLGPRRLKFVKTSARPRQVRMEAQMQGVGAAKHGLSCSIFVHEGVGNLGLVRLLPAGQASNAGTSSGRCRI